MASINYPTEEAITKWNRESRPFVGVFCVLLAGCFVAASSQGTSRTPDTHFFFSSAKALVAGEGFLHYTGEAGWQPLTHFPPAYSLVLTPFELAGVDLLVATRIINTLTFILIPLLVGRLFAGEWNGYWFCAPLVWAGVLYPFLHIQMSTASEGLFLVVTIPAWFRLLHYIERGARRDLLISGLMFGLGIMIRYAGVFAAGFCVATIILTGRDDLRRRVTDAIILGVLIVTPFALWCLRNQLVAGSGANREFGVHWPTYVFLRETVSVFSQLFVPKGVPGWLRVPIAVVFYALAAIGLYRVWRSGQLRTRERLLAVSAALWIVTYTGMLMVTVIFLDESTPTDTRLWSPTFPAVILLLLTPLRAVRDKFRMAGLVGLAVLTICNAAYTVSMAIDFKSNGFGNTEVKWTKSPMVEWLRQRPHRLCYSNYANQLYLHVEQGSYHKMPLPTSYGRVNPDYNSDFTKMINDMRANNGWLVLFTNLSDRQSAVQRIERVLNDERLEVIERFADGVVYSTRQ